MEGIKVMGSDSKVTPEEVKEAFKEAEGREPTKEELDSALKEVKTINDQIDNGASKITQEEAKEIAKEETGKDLAGDDLKAYTDQLNKDIGAETDP
jgi:hypothetical protein